jgi:hypothetical protein
MATIPAHCPLSLTLGLDNYYRCSTAIVERCSVERCKITFSDDNEKSGTKTLPLAGAEVENLEA